jgi:hypothetical protein
MYQSLVGGVLLNDSSYIIHVGVIEIFTCRHNRNEEEMMKIKISLVCLIIMCCILSLFGCSGGGDVSGVSSVYGDGLTGVLSLKITDTTTTEFQAVYITVDEIQASMTPVDENEEDADWITVAKREQTYNLLELVNGVTEHLGVTELMAGEYTQLRLILGHLPDDGLNILDEHHPFANYFIDHNDESYELKIPSGYESGFKIVGGFTIDEDETTDLILDFNVVKSLIQGGFSEKWILKPTVKVLNEDNAAQIVGFVADADTDEALEGVIVSAQTVTEESDVEKVVSSTVTDQDGFYSLFVNPGNYLVVAGKSGYLSAHEEVTVESGDEPILDFGLVQGDGEGTITGTVLISNGEDEQHVTVSIRQRMEDDSIVEVSSAEVANGGQYIFDLPEGIYSMVAIFVVNEEEMTMEANEAFVILDGTVIEFDILFENVDEDDLGDMKDHGVNPEKITICHKGRTITISSSALKAHLKHGDVEGSCEEVDDQEDEAIDDEEDEDTDDEEEYGQSKVTICHKGREIHVAESAVQAHLKHGDTVGPCDDGEEDPDEEPEGEEEELPPPPLEDGE